MTLTDPLLETRLRHDLTAVAEAVTGAPLARSAKHRRRWLALGAVGVVVPVLVGGATFVRSGPEYVDTIPPETIIVRGDIDGDTYLVVESRRTYCDGQGQVTGIEIVEEDENILGSEWNTVGYSYADVGGGCQHDTAAWLRDPSLSSNGGSEVGGTLLWVWAVHPDVTSVRITTDDDVVDLPPYPVDGAGYALYEVPKDVETYTVELMIGESPVPGTREKKRVPALR
jgi:hypothetical protein